MDRWAVAVVVHHPRAAEHAGERLPLPGRGVQAIAVPDQYSTRTYCRPMTAGDDHCRGRHVVSVLQVRLVSCDLVVAHRRRSLSSTSSSSGRPAANPARTPGACAARELRSLVMPCPPGAAGRGRSAGVGGGAACGDVAPRLTETDRTLQPAA